MEELSQPGQGQESDAPQEKKTKSQVHQKDLPVGSHPQKLAFKKSTDAQDEEETETKKALPIGVKREKTTATAPE